MKAIDYHWVHENGVDQFAKGIVRNHVTEFLYGVKCHLNKKTGRPKMSKSNKKLVKKAHAKSGSKAKLGFFTGMLGDLESEHDVYIPNASKTVETKKSLIPASLALWRWMICIEYTWVIEREGNFLVLFFFVSVAFLL